MTIGIIGTNDKAGTILLGAGDGSRENIPADSLTGTYNQQLRVIADLNSGITGVNPKELDVQQTAAQINQRVAELYYPAAG